MTLKHALVTLSLGPSVVLATFCMFLVGGNLQIWILESLLSRRYYLKFRRQGVWGYLVSHTRRPESERIKDRSNIHRSNILRLGKAALIATATSGFLWQFALHAPSTIMLGLLANHRGHVPPFSVLSCIAYPAAVITFATGSAYSLKPTRGTTPFPKVAFPRMGSATQRRVALQIYWFGMTRTLFWTAALVASIAIGRGIFADMGTVHEVSNTSVLKLSLWLGDVVLAVAALRVTWRVLEGKNRPIRGLIRLAECLYPEAIRPSDCVNPAEEATAGHLIKDYFQPTREKLEEIAESLENDSRYMENIFAEGGTTHPYAILFRACARRVRTFLANLNSLHGWVPEDLRDVLETVALLLAKARKPIDLCTKLAAALNAFDPQGNPDPTLMPPEPDKFRITVGRIADAADRTIKLTLAITSITALGIWVYSFIEGKIDMTELLKHLR